MRVAIDAERPEGEVARVEVVLEVEHAREAGAVPEWIFPRPVRLLRAQQIIDAGLHGRPRRRAGGEEGQQRPRRLAGRRRSAAGQLGALIALARLAPAAVGVLVADEPAHRALDE